MAGSIRIWMLNKKPSRAKLKKSRAAMWASRSKIRSYTEISSRAWMARERVYYFFSPAEPSASLGFLAWAIGRQRWPTVSIPRCRKSSSVLSLKFNRFVCRCCHVTTLRACPRALAQIVAFTHKVNVVASTHLHLAQLRNIVNYIFLLPFLHIDQLEIGFANSASCYSKERPSRMFTDFSSAAIPPLVSLLRNYLGRGGRQG